MNDNYINYGCELLSGNNREDEVTLSIVIPTYKRAKYLTDALDSIFKQDLKTGQNFTFEVIVVNNDPNDNMQELIDRYRDERVSFFRNSRNLGQVGNINQGVRIANGRFIAFLHDDDLLLPTYFAAVIPYLKDDIECLIPCYYSFYEKYKLDFKHKFIRGLTCYRKIYSKTLQLVNPDDYIWSFYDIYNAPTCGVVFLKKAIEEYGYFKDERGAAWDYYNFREFNKEHSVYLLHKYLGARRMYSGMSNSSRVQEDFRNDKLKLIDELKEHPFIKEYKDCIMDRRPILKYSRFKIQKEMYIHNHDLVGSKTIPLYKWIWLKTHYNLK